MSAIATTQHDEPIDDSVRRVRVDKLLKRYSPRVMLASMLRAFRDAERAGVMPVDAGVSDDDQAAINARRIVSED